MFNVDHLLHSHLDLLDSFNYIRDQADSGVGFELAVKLKISEPFVCDVLH